MKKLALLIMILISTFLMSSCLEDFGPLLSRDENGLLIVDNNKYKKIKMYGTVYYTDGYDTILRLKRNYDDGISIGYYIGPGAKRRRVKIKVYYNSLDLEKNFLWDGASCFYVKSDFEIPKIDDLVITRIEVDPIQFDGIRYNYLSNSRRNELFSQREEMTFEVEENETLNQMITFGISSKPDKFYKHIFEINFDFNDYPYLECSAFQLVVCNDSIYIRNTYDNYDYEIDEKYKDYFIDLVNRYSFDNYIN